MRQPSHVISYYPVEPHNNVRVVFEERFIGAISKFYVSVEDYDAFEQVYHHRAGSTYSGWTRDEAMKKVQSYYDAESQDAMSSAYNRDVAAGRFDVPSQEA